jgi:transcription initiation factor IIE alpha subunit
MLTVLESVLIGGWLGFGMSHLEEFIKKKDREKFKESLFYLCDRCYDKVKHKDAFSTHTYGYPHFLCVKCVGEIDNA